MVLNKRVFELLCLTAVVVVLTSALFFASRPLPTRADADVVALVDDFEYENGLPSGFDGDSLAVGYISWGDDWNGTTVDIAVTDTAVAGIDPVPDKDSTNKVFALTANVVGWGGFSHAFENDAVDTWVSQDWSTYEGIAFWYYGTGTGTSTFIDIAENRAPGSTSEDAERWSYEWQDDTMGWQHIEVPFSSLSRKEIGNGAPNDGWSGAEVHGWALGTLSTNGDTETRYVDDFVTYGNVEGEVPIEVAFASVEQDVDEGETATITVALNREAAEDVVVSYKSAESYAIADRDFVPVDGTLTIPMGQLEGSFTVETIDDEKYEEGNENLILHLTSATGADLGFASRTILNIIENDPINPLLLADFEGWHPFSTGDSVILSTMEVADDALMERPGQGMYEQILSVESGTGELLYMYPEPQDWSDTTGFTFWYYGANSGETVDFYLLDNAAEMTGDVAPNDWTMIWSDEFNDAAGTPPNPNYWTHEVGDGALNGIPGWGNGESQYYSDDPAHASTDGSGNLVITLTESDDPALKCWYGICEHISARLLTRDKMETKHGRIESRILVPSGGDGIDDGNGIDVGDGVWPAFWMLGDDIQDVGWPQTGEIDIMEVVSREPYDVFGTIHGPGYAGGASYGNTHVFAEPVSDMYHTFAVEWTPNEIKWYVDDILYHTAVPDDVAPNEWVFEHPFFILLNMAIGGNFGGAIGDNVGYPQEMVVDYVRVYGADDSAERFEASFVDDFTGWKQITLPLDDFVRSNSQPAGAPDDGLTLSAAMGYGFGFTNGDSMVMSYVDELLRRTGDLRYTDLYMSFDDVGTIDGISYLPADVMHYDALTGVWSKYFDGVAEGLDVTADIEGLMFYNGRLAMSFSANTIVLHGMGKTPRVIKPEDVVIWRPWDGIWFHGLDGHAYGLEQSGGIDAIDATTSKQGQALFSTAVGMDALEVTAEAEDLARLRHSVPEWILRFDGSDTGLSTADENINGVSSNFENGELYISTVGAVDVSGAAGDGMDILHCAMPTLGTSTSCTYSMLFDGSMYGLTANIDALIVE